jgi:6-pyruvoyltetrahydropterin/6-carboxytetrahydropterin synthase
MFRVTRVIHFCYGHRLLDYPGKCRWLHGHNGKLVVTLAGSSLDRLGMLRDFSQIKQTLGRWIDEHLDHKMILCRTDPVVAPLLAAGEPLYLMEENPTAENIARMIFRVAQDLGLPVLSIRLWETPHCSAVYEEPLRTEQARAQRQNQPAD